MQSENIAGQGSDKSVKFYHSRWVHDSFPRILISCQYEQPFVRQCFDLLKKEALSFPIPLLSFLA
jgi:hypothetical protein